MSKKLGEVMDVRSLDDENVLAEWCLKMSNKYQDAQLSFILGFMQGKIMKLQDEQRTVRV